MRNARYLAMLTVMLTSLFAAAQEAEEKEQQREKLEEHAMVVGEELAFHGVREFSIENQQVLSASVSRDKKSVLVRALRPGVCKLLLRASSAAQASHAIEVVVSLRHPKAILAELEDVVRDHPGLKLRSQKSRIYIEGTLKSAEELNRLRELERRFEGQVTLSATVPPPEAVRSVMIRLDLHHVSVRRRYSRHLGLRYPASVSGASALSLTAAGLTLGAGLFTQSTILGDLLPSLDFSEANGFIRLKRTDTLITENGARAVYREGAELPVRLTGALGAGSIERIFYGAELTVTPRLSANGNSVTLEIFADISQRDNAATQDGLPGRSLSQVRTVVQIPFGKSAMLAGVDLQSAGQTKTGLPWLSRIPVLGYLFGSESKESESAYGVVFITPTLVQESSAAVQTELERALRLFEAPTVLPLKR